jgi:hypothetical protein
MTREINNNNIKIVYLFTCWAQQPMASYRVSSYTDNGSMTAEDKTNKKTKTKENESA